MRDIYAAPQRDSCGGHPIDFSMSCSCQSSPGHTDFHDEHGHPCQQAFLSLACHKRCEAAELIQTALQAPHQLLIVLLFAVAALAPDDFLANILSTLYNKRYSPMRATNAAK